MPEILFKKMQNTEGRATYFHQQKNEKKTTFFIVDYTYYENTI